MDGEGAVDGFGSLGGRGGMMKRTSHVLGELGRLGEYDEKGLSLSS